MIKRMERSNTQDTFLCLPSAGSPGVSLSALGKMSTEKSCNNESLFIGIVLDAGRAPA